MIAVIGGGPAGGYFASKVKDACIYEEHLDIGKPVQCTGIVTGKIFDYVKLDNKFVVNKIKKVRLHSSNNEFSFRLKNEDYIIDRVKFDKKLVDNAVAKGAKLVKGWKFLDYSNGKVKFDKGVVKCDSLIGADGANSLVARKTGLWQDRTFLVGKQALVKGNFEKEAYGVYFDLIKEFFCWIVPENENFARVGCASYNNASNYFDKFLNRFDFKIVNYQGGLIPKFKKIKVCKDNVYLIGDAGLFIKDLTGGGLYYGIRSADFLAECFNNGKEYYQKDFGHNLWMNYKLRKILDKFSFEDWDYFLKLLNNYNIKNFDRDEIKIRDYFNLKLFWFVFRKMVF